MDYIYDISVKYAIKYETSVKQKLRNLTVKKWKLPDRAAPISIYLY